MPTESIDPNIRIVAQHLRDGRESPVDDGILQWMLARSETIHAVEPPFDVAGIDSSDNLLLRIPGQPGAGVAGYSFGLSVCGPDGRERAWQDRSVERESEGVTEELEIALVYNIPTRQERLLLSMADYQFRSLTTVAGGKSPYEDQENPPEFKLRLAAARSREITERRAIRTFLNQQRIKAPLFLKDGRLSSQNCSTRYMDDLGRLAVRRGVRLVGVVKQGTRLWDELYPYHVALSAHHRGAHQGWDCGESSPGGTCGTTSAGLHTGRIGGNHSRQGRRPTDPRCLRPLRDRRVLTAGDGALGQRAGLAEP